MRILRPVTSATTITIPDQVQVALRSRGMTGREFAKQIGMSYGRFRNVVSGTDKTPAAREKISKALGRPFWTEPESTHQDHQTAPAHD
jgi:transcriptional regulator with XRE-family HTH domain